MNKAIFLDRDGTVNEDSGYVNRIEEFYLIPGAVDGLRLLKNAGFKLFFITNQSGIGRGYYKEENFHSFQEHLLKELKKHGITIEKTHFCPHHPDDECDCRKPNPKSIIDMTKEFDIDLKKSFTIGDHPSDIELGKNAGIKAVFVLTGHGKKEQHNLKEKPDYIADNLLKAAEWIVKNEG
ncbi:D-glycero-beta-D-manno-heptose 1,7-bisphosphate 7-phosphatase [Candidatus Woesearchaeota archaeon]|nr:D-glycero-beta-D-manno-heptose 1,7-bisphosphate 7-phosphatase [Candidatus Woesearchaeota archaeon]